MIDQGLSGVDWAVVGIYFALVTLLGWLVRGTQNSTRDYFLGGRSLPWWAATLSIVATETSAVTFIGVPRLAYEGNWWFLQLVVGFVLGRFFLAAFFVRAFYRRDFETVYEYLGDRFGTGVQRLASLTFLVGRVAASGVRLFAGCLALQVAAGLPKEGLIVAVLTLGVCGVLLAFSGGIRTVVWTDVFLGFSILLGAVGILLLLAAQISGGVATLTTTPEWWDKIRVVDLRLGLNDKTGLIAGLAGGFVLTLATHGTDQDIAQRMLTCRDARAGSLSVLGSALLILPLMVLFLAVGTLLYFFHQLHPPEYPPPADLNHLVPHYIVREVPAGLRGFFMATLLAASLSSLTSALNALASITINDFYRPLRKRLRGGGREDEAEATHLLRASRFATFFWGGVLVLAALTFVGGDSNILAMALRALTYFYGALLGAFLLGIFTRRGSAWSVGSGMIVSIAAVVLLQARQFAAAPESAPSAVRAVVATLPEHLLEALTAGVPEIAWPYWIIIGTAVTFTVGLLGTRTCVVK